MSVLIPKSTSFFFSSDTLVGAQNVSVDGSEFTVVLDAPIALPQGAMSATLAVSQASVWNTSYNISAAFGNNEISIEAIFYSPTFFTLTIPDGLYSLSGLKLPTSLHSS